VRLAKRTSNLFRPRQATGHPGLDVSAFDAVLSVDRDKRTADVQGMTTYENLVDATLPHGLMPAVVPQLKTITLGGAVTGLGIESSSFRNGLPHETVRELEILTGAGDVVVATPDNEHRELFRAFPNSYGTLGYALRVTIDLEPVQPYVHLRHVRFRDLDALVDAVATIVDDRAHDGEPVDFLDGTVFSADECYLTLGSWSSRAPYLSDYTGTEIYYRSIRSRPEDYLTVRDYLWRWDTDWFWCSRAFGAQHPRVRRIWPKRWLRSDVYGKLVRLENRYGVAAAVDRRRGRPERERVVQDVEIPLERTAEFLRWFLEDVPIEPVWLCPLRLRGAATWPLYPLTPGRTYVQRRFLVYRAHRRGSPRRRRQPPHRAGRRRARWPQVAVLRRLLRRGAVLVALRPSVLRRGEEALRPRVTTPRPLREGGEAPVTEPVSLGGIFDRLFGPDAPARFSAYDGSRAGNAGAPIGFHLATERALPTSPRHPASLGLARAYVQGDLEIDGVHPGDPYDVLRLIEDDLQLQRPPAGEALAWLRAYGPRVLVPPPVPANEVRPSRWIPRHTKIRDARVISHHYDVSNRFYEMVLGPSMTYTCACYPRSDATLEEAQEHKYDLVARKLGLQPGMRLLDVGCGWGGMVRHAARHYGVSVLGVTLSREQATWAQEAIKADGLDDLAEVRHLDYRNVAERDFDAVSAIGLYRARRPRELRQVLPFPALAPASRRPAAQPRDHPPRQPAPRPAQARLHRPVTSSPTAGSRAPATRCGDGGRGSRGPAPREPSRALRADAGAVVPQPRRPLGRVRRRGRPRHDEGWGLYMAGSRLAFERNGIQLHQVLATRTGDDGDSGYPLRHGFGV
jgi:FAD/FMN-containing dehydrogenase